MCGWRSFSRILISEYRLSLTLPFSLLASTDFMATSSRVLYQKHIMSA